MASFSVESSFSSFSTIEMANKIFFMTIGLVEDTHV